MSQRYFVVFLESYVNGRDRGIATLTGDKRLGILDIWVPSLVEPEKCQGVLVYHQGRARVPIKTGHFISEEKGFRLLWEFKPGDVAGTGLSIYEFGEILVTQEVSNRNAVSYQGRLVTRKRAWQTASHK